MNLEKIIKNMPRDLNEIEKARWIYIGLCKEVSYDARYLTLRNYSKEQIREFTKKVYYKNLKNDKVICSTVSELYAQLLESTGIKANTIKEGNSKYLGHVFVAFEANGKKYYADPTRDLMKGKKGFQTESFGTKSYQDKEDMQRNGDKYKEYNFTEIPSEELRKIDNKLGYTKDGRYVEERILQYKSKIEEECKGLPPEQQMVHKINFIKENFDAKDLYAIDKAEYFSAILKELATKQEKEKYKVTTIKCVEKNKDVRVFFSMLINKKTNEKLIYTFSDKDYALKVDEKYIQDKMKKGMVTLSKDKEKDKAKILMELAEEPKNKRNITKEDIIGIAKDKNVIKEKANSKGIVELLRELREKVLKKWEELV